MHRSIAALLEDAHEHDLSAAPGGARAEMAESGQSEDEIRERIRRTLRVMHGAIDEGLRGDVRSPSGLTGGRAARLAADGPRLLGDAVTTILARAIGTLEVNAAMGLIVAAPTAGAAGVLPAILRSAGEILDADEDRLVDAMLVAGGVGGVIAHRASLSGAAGGCQAETGSAAAMGAAAVTWLAGGRTSRWPRPSPCRSRGCWA
jgi:L-serine dehydratase